MLVQTSSDEWNDRKLLGARVPRLQLPERTFSYWFRDEVPARPYTWNPQFHPTALHQAVDDLFWSRKWKQGRNLIRATHTIHQAKFGLLIHGGHPGCVQVYSIQLSGPLAPLDPIELGPLENFAKWSVEGAAS